MKHILLVDDNLVSLKQAQSLLADTYKVSMVKSGEQALAFLAKIEPDLILLDIEMPGMDGYETIAAIRENEDWRKIPVIFLTGNIGNETEIKCFEAGAVDYITKPFSKEVALHRISLHLDLYAYRQQLEQMVEERTKELIEAHKQQEKVNAELSVATDIQLSMLPHMTSTLEDRAEFDLFASCETAKEVGGDFYDYRLLDDDHLMVLIADVCGKGVPAALFMARVITTISAISRSEHEAARIMKATNDLVSENNDEDYFTTAFIGILEISTGKFSYCSAGHNPPLLHKSGGDVTLIEGQANMALGGFGGLPYSEQSITLNHGDQILLYTDGVDEAMDKDGNQYGLDRLTSKVQSLSSDTDAKSLLQAVRQDVALFVQDFEQSDDITMLGLIYK